MVFVNRVRSQDRSRDRAIVVLIRRGTLGVSQLFYLQYCYDLAELQSRAAFPVCGEYIITLLNLSH